MCTDTAIPGYGRQQLHFTIKQAPELPTSSDKKSKDLHMKKILENVFLIGLMGIDNWKVLIYMIMLIRQFSCSKILLLGQNTSLWQHCSTRPPAHLVLPHARTLPPLPSHWRETNGWKPRCSIGGRQYRVQIYMSWGPLLCVGDNSEHGNGEGGYPQHEKGVVSRDMFVEIAIVTSKEAVAIG